MSRYAVRPKITIDCFIVVETSYFDADAGMIVGVYIAKVDKHLAGAHETAIIFAETIGLQLNEHLDVFPDMGIDQ